MMATKTTDAPTTTDTPLILSFRAARRVSTPIVAVETADPAATMRTLVKALTEKKNGGTTTEKTIVPIFLWDSVKGLRGYPKNDAAALVLERLDGYNQKLTVNPVGALVTCEGLPEESVVIFANFHRHMEQPPEVQALWNLRDQFKVNKRMAILLGPAFKLRPELTGDVIVLDEPVPTRDVLSAVLDKQYVNIDLPRETDPDRRSDALDAVVGVSSVYTAEQVIAMSLTKTGLNVAGLWQRKIKALENEGLKVWKVPAPMEDLQGIDNVKAFFLMLTKARAFEAIVFIDEADKAFAGAMSGYAGDGNVTQDQNGMILSFIQDHKSIGVLLGGVAGTGKSQLAKAVGYASGKPVIVLDLGGMKKGLVGSSEQAIRSQLKVIEATAEGRVLFIATANRTSHFTPEMSRRFPDQFFFDTPDDAGRSAIWKVYTKKFNLTASQATRPAGFDAGWNGDEIERACSRAAMLGATVVDVAQYIIPNSVSKSHDIKLLRQDASGRFLSASAPGLYRMGDGSVVASRTNRQIDAE